MQRRLIFDSHAHYASQAFDDDREELLAALPLRGIYAVTSIGADKASSESAVALANRYDYIYATVGFHPSDISKFDQSSLDFLRETATNNKKVRAIGEMGLDYYYEKDNRERQIEVFKAQLELAKKLDLPTVIHSRDAAADTLDILTSYQPEGVVHCFSYSKEVAAQLVSLGLYIGITGVVTFKNARKIVETAAALPLDRMLIETDCPYMAPVPHRGKRCDSSMLVHTADVLAQIKGITREELLIQTARNACRFYRLPEPQLD